MRLAARGTVSEAQQQQTSQDARYAASSYYTHPNIYSPPTYSPQQLQPLQLPQQLVVPETTQTLSESTSSSTRLSSSSATSSSSKRQLPEEDSTTAPKAKRAKAKTKSGTPGSTSATTPGALSVFLISFYDTRWFFFSCVQVFFSLSFFLFFSLVSCVHGLPGPSWSLVSF